MSSTLNAKTSMPVEDDECASCGTTCLDHTSNKGRGSESPCSSCEELRCKHCPCECDEASAEYWETDNFPEFFEKVIDAMNPEDRDKFKLWLFERMTELTRKEAIDHWKWLGAKTQVESSAYMEKVGIRKYVRRFNKCLDQIDAKCLCGQMEGDWTWCEFRKGKKRCDKCKVGGDFFPWDEEDLKLISKLDLEECYDLDF